MVNSTTPFLNNTDLFMAARTAMHYDHVALATNPFLIVNQSNSACNSFYNTNPAGNAVSSNSTYTIANTDSNSITSTSCLQTPITVDHTYTPMSSSTDMSTERFVDNCYQYYVLP